MKASTAMLLCAATGLLACARDHRPSSTQGSAPAPAQPAPLSTTATPPVVDKVDPPLTPASSNGEARPVATPASFVPLDPDRDKPQRAGDVESIREIRQALAADKSLSESARKVIIVVREGRVWLRGNVNSTEERAAVERAARQAAGVITVRNELAVME